MKEFLELKAPILINGKPVKKLSYDIEEITGEHFLQADAMRNAARGSSPGMAAVAEFDYSMHYYLGMMAIIAVNPAIDVQDLRRVKGLDIAKITGIGRNFYLGSVDASGETTSEEPIEPTAGPSAAP